MSSNILKSNPLHQNTSLRQKIILMLFGVFLCFIILEAGLRLGGFIFLFLQERRNIVSLRQKGAFRIMCLGESTTALGGAYSYPSQLEQILNQRNIGIKFSVINKGIGASNTVTILYDLEDNLNKYKPDMVITMMGRNDCAVHMPFSAEDSEGMKISLCSLKIYNFVRYLWLHISTKAKEITASFRQKREHNIEQNMLVHAQGSLKDNSGQNPVIKVNSVAAPLEKSYLSQLEFYVSSGYSYLGQGEYAKAEESFKKALEINPNNDGVYVTLGLCYQEQKKYALAEESFKKAIELNPKNSFAYSFLGDFYRKQNNYAQAKELFEKAVALDPENHSAWTALWQVYDFYGEYDRTEESIRRFMESNKKKGREGMGYFNLIELYKSRMTHISTEARQAQREKLKALISDCINHVTVPNYLKLKTILGQRGIKLVCVQYPMLSIEPMKKIFEEQDGIIFVDNEKLFKEAVDKYGYREYFIDKFGGCFGHCTRSGNRLLAENIASVIVKKYFHR
jgi:tetratricopeptide (TPR) repeat protein